MAGRTQPIVYKPTNVTKYADAYANRLYAEKQRAAAAVKERDKEQKKLYEELGMYSDVKYTSPVYQRAYNEKLKEFKSNAMSDLDNFGRYLKEFGSYVKKLNDEDKNISSAVSNFNKKRDNYRNPEEFLKNFREYSGEENLDPNDLGALTTQAISSFSILQESFDVGQYVASEGNKILGNLAADPQSAGKYFDEDINVRDIGKMSLTQVFKKVKPSMRKEVMDIIISSNDKAKGQIMWDYSKGIEDPDVAYSNAISGATEDMFSLLSIAPFERALKNTEEEGESGFNYLGDNTWSNGAFSFVRGETKKGRTLKFQEEVDTDFISIEQNKTTRDVPIQEYFYEGQNIKGRVKGIEKVGNTTYAVVPTIIEVDEVINGVETGEKVKEKLDARVELDPTYNLSIFTNAYKISPSQLESMFSNERGETQSNERGETQSGNVGYNNPKNKRFPPPPPSMGQ